MSIIRGCLGKVTFNSAVVGELRGYDVTETAGRREQSVMGDCTKKYGHDAVETSITLRCYFDRADAGQALLVPAGTEQTIDVRPGGDTSGQPTITASGSVESRAISSDVNGDVEATYTIVVDGALTIGAIP